MRLIITVLAAASSAFVTLAGCGTTDSAAPAASPAASTTATTQAPSTTSTPTAKTTTHTPTPTPSHSTCEPAAELVKVAIEEGLDESWGLTVGRTAIVPAPDRDVYYVAAELNFPDGATDVAVWETSDNEGFGYMQSADAMAESFSNYPQLNSDITTPGVKEAKACLE